MSNIILVDDHAVVRKGLKMILEEAGHNVIAEAGNGYDAYDLAIQNDFEVMVMDNGLPGQSGLETAKKIRKDRPKAKILILTMHDQSEYIREAIDAKINGFVLKNSNPDELLSAISVVVDGGKYFDPKTVNQLLEVAVEKRTEPLLSKRELEIIKLAADGLTNKEIAAKLGIGMYTVRDHLRNVYDKLNVSDRAQAVATAMRLKIIK